ATLNLRRGAAHPGLDPPAAVVITIADVAGVGDLVDQLIRAVVVQGAPTGGAEGLGAVPGEHAATGDRRGQVGAGVPGVGEGADARIGAARDVADREHGVRRDLPIRLYTEGVAGEVAGSIQQREGGANGV